MRWALLLPALLSVSGMLFPERSDGLAKEYQSAFQARALETYYQRPVYKLGGDLCYGSVDCSEFVRDTAEKAGLPITEKRTQAWRIYKGHDGFTGMSLPDGMRSPEVADLLCLRVPGSLDRPYGINHVGAVILWRGVYQVIDANSRSKGIRIMPFGGIWQKHLPDDGYRRLNIGDK